MEEDERERGASRERAVGFRLVVILAVDVPYSKKSPSVKRRTRGDRERERERERESEREREAAEEGCAGGQEDGIHPRNT